MKKKKKMSHQFQSAPENVQKEDKKKRENLHVTTAVILELKKMTN